MPCAQSLAPCYFRFGWRKTATAFGSSGNAFAGIVVPPGNHLTSAVVTGQIARPLLRGADSRTQKFRQNWPSAPHRGLAWHSPWCPLMGPSGGDWSVQDWWAAGSLMLTQGSFGCACAGGTQRDASAITAATGAPISAFFIRPPFSSPKCISATTSACPTLVAARRQNIHHRGHAIHLCPGEEWFAFDILVCHSQATNFNVRELAARFLGTLGNPASDEAQSHVDHCLSASSDARVDKGTGLS